MSELEVILLTALISTGVTIVSSALAFRIGIERRLATVETTLDQHPPTATADRLRDHEARILTLESEDLDVTPLGAFLLRVGEGALWRTDRKGA